ncbi:MULTISPECIES: hypothetical protein [Azospirillum]|uniref:NnrS family protein n=1 Tax=Azospirillum brasilense TaxID=192 RepID=A0ABU4PE90_AZOBR|nr:MULTISPECIES: hypothetical protein [Azospirillum]MDX5955920.1 hypothetical protein [Azospirillum brasilense]
MPMSFSPTMAAGAPDRLLPPSVPFRFFGSAILFNAAAWLALALGDDPVTGYLGGKGPVLAALHLLTLGVLATTALGAAYQLLPMATARPVRSVRWSQASFWLFVPGVALFASGLTVGERTLTHAGAVLLSSGLAVFVALTVDNLRGTADMPLVRRHVQLALVSLVAVVLLGLVLLSDFDHGLLPNHPSVAMVHMALAGYGFMGMLVMGFSTILVPMLALAHAPDVRLGRWVLGLAASGLMLVLAGGVAGVRFALPLAAIVGLAAGLLHVHAMAGVLKRRMRRRLGTSFVLIRVGWGFLIASLVLALALSLGAPLPPALLGVLLVPGWLLTTLFGFLQRIMPTLAQAHLSVPGARVPLVSALTAETPLKVHAMSHLSAVALLASATVLGSEVLVRLAAGGGLIAAIAFGFFAVILFHRAGACRQGE